MPEFWWGVQKIWTVVLERIQQCFDDIRFGHSFSKCYNLAYIVMYYDDFLFVDE